jgi:hypothetical protein
MNLLEAIIIAGGPAPTARLKDVRVIMRGEHYSSVATVNLDQYAKMGSPAPFFLNPGDTIFIPRRRNLLATFFQNQRGNLVSQMLSIVVGAFTTYFVYSLILDQGQ